MLRENEEFINEYVWMILSREFNYDMIEMARQILEQRQTIFWMSRTITRKSHIIEEFRKQQMKVERSKGMIGFGKEKIIITA